MAKQTAQPKAMTLEEVQQVTAQTDAEIVKLLRKAMAAHPGLTLAHTLTPSYVVAYTYTVEHSGQTRPLTAADKAVPPPQE